MSANKASNADHVFARGLFDPVWYRNTHRDVVLTGLDPEYHYRSYGFPIFSRAPNADIARDPVQRSALKLAPPAVGFEAAEAYGVQASGESALGLAYGRLYVPETMRHVLQILEANVALAANDQEAWLTGLNTYLAHYNVAPLCLLPGDGPAITRFAVPSVKPVEGGPLVSVIMPAWNAEEWIAMAVGSILQQSWRNLELIVVDDASSDGTWAALQTLAARDKRLKIRRNKVNVGPYVSKNLGLDMAQGDWITGHDADDWAHPLRIEEHLRAATAGPTPLQASVTQMIRMQPSGHFDTIVQVNPFSPDGVTRVSSISTLFEGEFLRKKLGYWDSVRFGADSEMIARAQKLLREGFRELPQIGMICLSTETGLTNHPDFGIRSNAGRPAPDRSAYKASWTTAHLTMKKLSQFYLPFPQENRRYRGKFSHDVSLSDLKAVIAN